MSWRLSISIIIAVFILSTSLYISKKSDTRNSISINTYKESEVLQDKSTTEEKGDTDSDGLYDWEETLWNTDPTDNDSDDDGTLDGQEIVEKRNPLIKGPNDTLSKTIAEDTKKIDTEPKSNTDKLAREFINEYINLKQLGLLEDKKSVEVIMQNMARNSIVDIKLKNYEIKDIKVFESDSIEDIRKYGLSLGNIFNKYKNIYSTNELEILSNSLNKENLDDSGEEEIVKLEKISKDYESFFKEIIILRVPSPLAKEHLAFVNAIEHTKNIVSALSKAFSDSTLALSALPKYNETSKDLILSTKNIRLKIENYGIMYDDKESGYVLFNLTNEL